MDSREAEERRRLVIRLKGFSSTLRRRALCRVSELYEIVGCNMSNWATHLLQLGPANRKKTCFLMVLARESDRLS